MQDRQDKQKEKKKINTYRFNLFRTFEFHKFWPIERKCFRKISEKTLPPRPQKQRRALLCLGRKRR